MSETLKKDALKNIASPAIGLPGPGLSVAGDVIAESGLLKGSERLSLERNVSARHKMSVARS